MLGQRLRRHAFRRAAASLSFIFTPLFSATRRISHLTLRPREMTFYRAISRSFRQPQDAGFSSHYYCDDLRRDCRAIYCRSLRHLSPDAGASLATIQ